MSRKTSFGTITAAELTGGGEKIPQQKALPLLFSESFLLFCLYLITYRKQYFVVASFWTNDTMHYLSMAVKRF